MKMLRRLLDNVGRSWDRIPKDVPVLRIEQGAGIHSRYTVDGSSLYLHTMPYNRDLPVKQSIVLEDLTFEELADVLNGMGYIATVLPEVAKHSLSKRKAHTLRRETDKELTSEAELSTFTSKMWERLYPIAKLLESVDYDVDRAIRQMFATTAGGRWLEYWASFFGIRRIPGEVDESLRKRIFLVFANIKANNIAIEELVRYIIQDDFEVFDAEPALMELNTHPKYMDKGSQLHATMMAVKAGGVDYILNFMHQWEEDFRSHIADKTGRPFRSMDILEGAAARNLEELQYGYTVQDMSKAFRLNVDRLNSSKVTSPGNKYLLKDEVTFGVAFEDVFPVNRDQRDAGSTYFRLNIGKLNSRLHRLYGEGDYGDIMESITVACSEVFALPSEVGMTPHLTVDNGEDFREPRTKGAIGFRLGASRIGSAARLAKKDERTVEGGSMRLVLDGTVVQELAW